MQLWHSLRSTAPPHVTRNVIQNTRPSFRFSGRVWEQDYPRLQCISPLPPPHINNKGFLLPSREVEFTWRVFLPASFQFTGRTNATPLLVDMWQSSDTLCDVHVREKDMGCIRCHLYFPFHFLNSIAGKETPSPPSPYTHHGYFKIIFPPVLILGGI